MVYTVERAELVAAQLRKFTSGYAHHVAGHFANLDYWLDEAESSLASIDGHNDRFDALVAGQEHWVERHQTLVPTGGPCPLCAGRCEFDDGSTMRPPAPRNKATTAKNEARRDLVDAVYYFLARCCRMRLITEFDMARHCERFGASVDPADIRST